MAEALYDEESEKALLANIFQEPQMVNDVADIVDPTDFYDPRNELIYSTIVELAMAGADCRPASVASVLRAAGKLDNAGGILYLRDLINPTDIAGFGSDPLTNAAAIHDSSKRRKLLAAMKEIEQEAEFGSGFTGAEAVESAEAKLQALLNEEGQVGGIRAVADLYDEAVVRIRNASDLPEGVTTGINTGFPDLDAILGGLHPTRLYYLAARPGSGKTTIALDFARAAVFLQSKTVLFFSLEMSQTEVVEKVISAEARVSLKKLQNGDLNEEEWFSINEAEAKIKNGHLLVDSSPLVNLSKVRSTALRQKARPEGIDMIIIDYLQLMQIPQANKNDNRQVAVSDLSRGMKLLAKELNVPIIVLSQLNRGSENRADSQPKISDLRESGSLEQDADVVILINRPEVNDANTRPGEVDVIVGKNRHGPQGKVLLTSMLEYSKFVSAHGIIAREEDGGPIAPPGQDEEPW